MKSNKLNPATKADRNIAYVDDFIDFLVASARNKADNYEEEKDEAIIREELKVFKLFVANNAHKLNFADNYVSYRDMLAMATFFRYSHMFFAPSGSKSIFYEKSLPILPEIADVDDYNAEIVRNNANNNNASNGADNVVLYTNSFTTLAYRFYSQLKLSQPYYRDRFSQIVDILTNERDGVRFFFNANNESSQETFGHVRTMLSDYVAINGIYYSRTQYLYEKLLILSLSLLIGNDFIDDERIDSRVLDFVMSNFFNKYSVGYKVPKTYDGRDFTVRSSVLLRNYAKFTEESIDKDNDVPF